MTRSSRDGIQSPVAVSYAIITLPHMRGDELHARIDEARLNVTDAMGGSP